MLKKNRIIFSLIISLLFTGSAITANAGPERNRYITVVIGDFDNSGVADLTDLSSLCVFLMDRNGNLDKRTFAAADIDINQQIDIADLARLKQYVSKDMSIPSLGTIDILVENTAAPKDAKPPKGSEKAPGEKAPAESKVTTTVASSAKATTTATKATTTAAKATTAATKATTTAAKATTAATKATTASTKATTASTKATTASTKATTASTKATTASTKADTGTSSSKTDSYTVSSSSSLFPSQIPDPSKDSSKTQLFNWINSMRQNAGISSLKLSPELSYVADIRAKELSSFYSGATRPDGSAYSTLLSQYGMLRSRITQLVLDSSGVDDFISTMSAYQTKFINSGMYQCGIGYFAANGTDYIVVYLTS